MKNCDLESIKIALEYASLCSESIEFNKKRIERQEEKLENLKYCMSWILDHEDLLKNFKGESNE